MVNKTANVFCCFFFYINGVEAPQTTRSEDENQTEISKLTDIVDKIVQCLSTMKSQPEDISNRLHHENTSPQNTFPDFLTAGSDRPQNHSADEINAIQTPIITERSSLSSCYPVLKNKGILSTDITVLNILQKRN